MGCKCIQDGRHEEMKLEINSIDTSKRNELGPNYPTNLTTKEILNFSITPGQNNSLIQPLNSFLKKEDELEEKEEKEEEKEDNPNQVNKLRAKAVRKEIGENYISFEVKEEKEEEEKYSEKEEKTKKEFRKEDEKETNDVPDKDMTVKSQLIAQKNYDNQNNEEGDYNSNLYYGSTNRSKGEKNKNMEDEGEYFFPLQDNAMGAFESPVKTTITPGKDDLDEEGDYYNPSVQIFKGRGKQFTEIKEGNEEEEESLKATKKDFYSEEEEKDEKDYEKENSKDYETESKKEEDQLNKIGNSITNPFSNTDFEGDTEYCAAFLTQLNKVRTNPIDFVNTILENKKYIKYTYSNRINRNRKIYQNKVKVALSSGEEAFDNAIKDLESRQPCNPLIYDKKLCISPPPEEEEGYSKEYLKQKIEEKRSNGITIDNCFLDRVKYPEISLLLLIVDDTGVKEGKKRKILLDPNIATIGISSKVYNNHFVSYFTFSKVYQE
ncbi:MAG: hypothetical protein MJ252_07385 [archaeon]|nr:hypothetical protein [archaeon]